MADNQQAVWQKLLSTLASIESHLRQSETKGLAPAGSPPAADLGQLIVEWGQLNEEAEKFTTEATTQAELQQKTLANLEDQARLLKRAEQSGANINQQAKEALDARIAGLKQLIKDQETSNSLVDGFAKTVFGITDLEISDTGLGKLFDPSQWALLGNRMKEVFTISKIGASIYRKLLEATTQQVIALDQSRASMQRATALGAGYNDMLSDNANALRSVGLGYAEAAQGIMAVQTNMSNFALLSREAQGDLSLAAAANEQLGISADVTARNMNTMMQAMGMTTEAAISHSNELASLAISLGRPPQQVAEDFAAAAPQLAQFGSRMTGVFEELQIQAAATGVSMQELLNIAERMDTFDGAADAAGRLNAVLGGSGGMLNSIDLLAAEGPEKIRLIQQAFQRSGQTMAGLDRHSQRYVASILGTDVAQATRLLTGSIGDQEAALRSLSQEEEDLATQREQAASIQQKLTALMSAFGVAVMPLVEMITGVLTPLSQLITKNKLLFQVLSSIVIGWSLYRKMMMARAALAAAELPTLAAKTLAYKELGKAKAKAAVAGRGAGAGGILGIGAIPILLTVAALVLAIGVAIGVAAFGMSKLVEAFADFAEAISVEKMRALAMLGIAAPGFLLAAAALPFLALGIGALAGALMLLPEQKLVSLQGSFEAIDGAITAVAQAPDAPLKIMAVIDKASELADKQLELRTDVLSATADMITSTFAEAFGTGGQAAQDVVLVLKDREFARAVNAVVQDNLQATVIRG